MNKWEKSQIDRFLNLPRKMFLTEVYRTYYHSISYGKKATRLFQRYTHKSVESENLGKLFPRVIEFGAFQGEHLPFVQHKYFSYICADLISPPNQQDYSKFLNVEFVIDDVTDSKFADSEFDRVLCMCLLHHIFDVEQALLEIRRLVKQGGTIDIFLPNDPGFLYRLAKQLQYITAMRNGFLSVKKLLDARDHIGHYWSIRQLILHTFRNDSIKERNYPFPKLAHHFNLWTVFHISKNF